jgi:AraC-like DNA-binding protein
MSLLERVNTYVGENLGERVEIVPWSEEGSLPLYLREPYEYHATRIHGRDVLLMVVRSTDVPSPAVIAKQSGTVRNRAELEPVVVFPSLSAYNRKRLVERGVSFIVPGNQMYLAPLGIDFRERHRTTPIDVQTVQPATQSTIVALLTRRLPEAEYSPSEIAEKLGYSPMTMTRVFRELKAISFGEQEESGRTRRLRIGEADRRELWTGVLPHLATPVKRIETVFFPDDSRRAFPVAGMSALARLTNLAEPRRATIAVDGSLWRSLLTDRGLEEVPSMEESATMVEVWTYPPQVTDGAVDSLSLYLSLRNSPDERVQGAITQLLERFPW